MQCVERGLVTLDEIPTRILPELEKLQLLEGWTADDEPILSKPKTLPTVRQLLSHQSGIGVDISEPALMKWNKYKKRATNSQTGNLVSIVTITCGDRAHSV
jgi:CubicO group peptidase (beta-lactamase class C family)